MYNVSYVHFANYTPKKDRLNKAGALICFVRADIWVEHVTSSLWVSAHGSVSLQPLIMIFRVYFMSPGD